ncbi:MAG: PilT/PilU family type 4a pilus ATPase [Verrucomicrobia bacterium]|jgi:twitching motility protein PilT|nr:PilT/PilU family type 4a pilus ATPase [Verrucomicrobiota bacterium]
MSIIHDLLSRATAAGASDIHIKTNQEPFYRVNSELTESGFEPLSRDAVMAIINDIIPPYLRDSFDNDHEADFSHAEEGVGRFRVNLFMCQGSPTLALRHVKDKIPSFSDIHVPEGVAALAHIQRGIVLLSGTTGSGKSTTLAAILGEINRTQRRRIITIEDPIEYVFEDDQSIITQREVGLDTMSFESSLKHLMRQDPDVILIGEMRDPTSIRTAFLAAETGHLVLSTLHAGTADQAIPRILDVFPATEHASTRMAVAANLRAVVCQRLIPASGGGVVPAVEILINTSTVRKLLEQNQLETLGAAIETGGEDGMQSFNQSIYELIKSGAITEADGMLYATNPESLRMNLQGIFLDEGKRILGG